MLFYITFTIPGTAGTDERSGEILKPLPARGLRSEAIASLTGAV
jgi:hypothetical protein